MYAQSIVNSLDLSCPILHQIFSLSGGKKKDKFGLRIQVDLVTSNNCFPLHFCLFEARLLSVAKNANNTLT